jgi:transposase-like protein
MISWKLWQPRPRKKNKEYRSWRPRKEYFGEMEQFDGSYHPWFEQRGEKCCLLASIDDATGKITKLRFVDWEGVKPAFEFWKEYLKNYGKPLKIYLDRHSTYKQNQNSIFNDPQVLTQFERAMKDLDIEVIHVHSSQARQRAERLFTTLQDRLVKELRLVNISTKEEANRFIEEVFIPRFNQKFGVIAQKKGNLHR